MLALIAVTVSGGTVDAATLPCRPPATAAMLRREIVHHIVNAEAARDAQGRIRVHALDARDGGGRFEIAGVNSRYHGPMARELRGLIERGLAAQAEEQAIAYIAAYTDPLARWAKSGAVAYLLRDLTWNRGPTGAVRILQIALNVTEDGAFGPQTLRALMRAQDDPVKLIFALRVARERYERRRRDEDSPFWQGLVNRWETATERALCFL